MSKKKRKDFSVVAGDLYVVEVHIFAPTDDPSFCSLIKFDKHVLYSENIPSDEIIKQFYQTTIHDCARRGELLPDIQYQSTIDVYKEVTSFSCCTSFHYAEEKISIC